MILKIVNNKDVFFKEDKKVVLSGKLIGYAAIFGRSTLLYEYTISSREQEKIPIYIESMFSRFPTVGAIMLVFPI